MDGGLIVDIAREAVLVMIRMSLPLLLTALTIGVAISLVQALTQIQEATISFVPKMLGIFVMLLLLLPYMGKQMSSFTNYVFGHMDQIRDQ